MRKVMILGAGRIGRLMACLLKGTNAYDVILVDSNADHLEPGLFGSLNKLIERDVCDVTDHSALRNRLKHHQVNAVISCLPYFCNPQVAELARELGITYFDLTEDVQVTKKVFELAESSEQPFAPQCGLAPGFVSIAANALMQDFDSLDAAFLRVGALPVYPNNLLKYSLSWSTDGLINEYGNTCFGIFQGKAVELQPLEGLETLQIDGLLYEAFNTSGGLGTLGQTYFGKINTMNYKSLRYPGHCESMRFLMNDLKLNEDRATLKRILENAIPSTQDDVVVIYIAVRGYQQKRLTEKTYVKKIYPKVIAGLPWTAIQVTTASSACAVIDEVLTNIGKYRGFVKQEAFSLKNFLGNRFGNIFA
ncbi:MAG: saccharopine dehydrogenase C-terminal domain-containing protein [Gammaproteobacteria bacterium]